VNGSDDGLIRMKTDLSVLVSPDETDWEAPAQFSAGTLIANASFEADTYYIHFVVGHGFFRTG
jgi:hypothetical protein